MQELTSNITSAHRVSSKTTPCMTFNFLNYLYQLHQKRGKPNISPPTQLDDQTASFCWVGHKGVQLPQHQWLWIRCQHGCVPQQNQSLRHGWHVQQPGKIPWCHREHQTIQGSQSCTRRSIRCRTMSRWGRRSTTMLMPWTIASQEDKDKEANIRRELDQSQQLLTYILVHAAKPSSEPNNIARTFQRSTNGFDFWKQLRQQYSGRQWAQHYEFLQRIMPVKWTEQQQTQQYQRCKADVNQYELENGLIIETIFIGKKVGE